MYAVGTADPGRLGHLLSAVFARGNNAVLSHRSAAVLWRLLVLIDLAATRSRELERAVEEGFVNKLIGRTRMQDALDRANGRAGTGRLRR